MSSYVRISSLYASYAEKEMHVQNIGREEFEDAAEICESLISAEM